MRRLLLLIAGLWLALGSRAFGAGQVGVLPLIHTGAPSTTVTNFVGLTNANGLWSATEGNSEAVFGGSGASAFALSNWRMLVVTGPGATGSYAFTIRKNEADTALVLNLASGTTTGSDLAHSVTFNPGDRISIKAIPTGTPASLGNMAISFTTTAAIANSYPILYTNGAVVPAATQTYLPLMYGGSATTEATVQSTCPTAGTISSLYVDLDVAPTNAITVVLRKAATDQALIVTISGAAKTGSDVTHTVTVAAGDLLDWSVLSATGATSVRVRLGASFNPTVGSESVLCTTPGAPQAQNTNAVLVGNSLVSGGDGTLQCPIPACSAKKLFTDATNSPPVAGQNCTFTVRKAGADTSPLVQAIATNGAPIASDTTHTATYADGDTFDIKSLTSATSSNVGVRWGLVLDVTQPTGGGAANPDSNLLMRGLGLLPPSLFRTDRKHEGILQ